MKLTKFLLKKYKLSIISLDWVRNKDPKVSLGHGSILAKLFADKQLQDNNVEVKSFEYDVKDSFQFFNDFCYNIALKSSSNTDMIAMGAFVWNEAHIQKILTILRDDLKYNGKITLGGPQVSYALLGTLEKFYPTVDYFVRGYAETAFTDLVKAQFSGNKLKIPGVHFAKHRDLGLQANIDFDNLPSPFLSSVIDTNRTFIRWESQRGCPFRCTFCQHRDSYSARQSMCSERIESEIKLFCDTKISKINDIAVLDPTFNSGTKYLQVLDKFIAHKYSGKLAFQIRLEMINDEFLNKLNKLQELNNAQITLECGIQTVIKDEMKIIKRQNNLKKIEIIAKQLNERQIPFEISIIYGLPKQTLDSFKRTLDYCKTILKPNLINAWPLMLLRGTELELRKNEFALEQEILSADNLSFDLPKERIYEGIPHVTSSSSFTKKDWLKMNEISNKLF